MRTSRKTRWTIRNYNAFLRAVREKYDLDLRTAREAYRQLRDKLERSPVGADVKRHPRLTKAAVERARRAVKRKPPKAPPKPPREIGSTSQWAKLAAERKREFQIAKRQRFEGTASYTPVRDRLRYMRRVERQSVQVVFEVKAPPDVLERLTAQFFREALLRTASGETMPFLRLALIVWSRRGITYTYDDPQVMPVVLKKAIYVFGIANFRFA